MIEYISGDMFENLQEGDAIAHGCNCQGIMGAGVAGIVSARWPEMYTEYRRLCQAGLLRPGDVYPYVTPDGIIVFNLMTQDFPGKDAKLSWIMASVNSMLYTAWRSGLIKQIRIPAIGAGIGGLKFEDVKKTLEKVITDHEDWTGKETANLILFTLPRK